MQDGITRLAASYFNAIWREIDLRLLALEAVRADWEAAVQLLIGSGLDRINAALAPAFAQIEQDTASVRSILDDLPVVATQQALADATARPAAVVYSYDESGRITGMLEQLPKGGKQTTFTRNEGGKLATIVESYDGMTRTETITYLPDGKVERIDAEEVAA
jgi:hypothetical protein